MPREISHILIRALYHPPKADNGKMLDYLISSLDAVSRQYPQVGIILLCDFNELPDSQLRSYPMRQLVTSPTRKLTLDKIYTNTANWFEKPVVLPGISRSDHDSVLMAPSACPQRPRRRMLQQCRRSSDPNGKTLLCYHLKHFDCRTSSLFS